MTCGFLDSLENYHKLFIFELGCYCIKYLLINMLCKNTTKKCY